MQQELVNIYQFLYHQISTSNAFSNLVRIKIKSQEQVFSALYQDIWKESSIENLLIILSQPKHYGVLHVINESKQ